MSHTKDVDVDQIYAFCMGHQLQKSRCDSVFAFKACPPYSESEQTSEANSESQQDFRSLPGMSHTKDVDVDQSYVFLYEN